MVSRRLFVVGSLCSAGAAGSAWAEPESPAAPSLADIFRLPLVGDAALSPGGTRIALLGQAAPAPGKAPQALVEVFNGDFPRDAPVRVPLTDLQADAIDWASEDRLLIWITAAAAEGGLQRRVLAIGADGRDAVVLFSTSGRQTAQPKSPALVDSLPDDPDHILMTAHDPALQVAALYRVNVRNGHFDLIERGEAATISWRCQDGTPLLRYDMDRDHRVVSLLARAPGETDWRLVRRIRRDQASDFQVVGGTPDAAVVLVAARRPDEDAASVRTLDTRTMAFGPVVSSRPGRDVATVVASRRKAFVAAAYYEDRLTYDFADARLGRRFRALNAQFGEDCNVELFDVDDSQTRWLARISGPKEPGAYVYYDCATGRATRLGALRPWLRPERLAQMQPITVRTRDGAAIRAYLTTPLQAGRRPLVVMPHGGPEIRDHLDYDPWAQALAAQGWLVLQPNFRGSGGYGRRFAEAGWGHWGDRMQADVEDSVDLLVRQGRADPDRIAIFGASYGGYAALMGAVRRPDLYKAVVAASAPSDLPEMLRFEKRTERGDAAVYDFWRERMGDPAKDAAALERASPRLRAAEIKAPVLLIHGAHDEIVPPIQSRQMAAALRAAGRPCRLYEMKDAGHTDWGLFTEQAVLQKVVEFLKPALA